MSYLRRHRTSAASVLSKARELHPRSPTAAPAPESIAPLRAALTELEAACLGKEEMHLACALCFGIVDSLISNREDRKYRYLIAGELLTSRLLRHGAPAIAVLRSLGYTRRPLPARRVTDDDEWIDEFECAEPDWALLALASGELRRVLERVDSEEARQLRGAAALGRQLFAHSLRKDDGAVAWAV